MSATLESIIITILLSALPLVFILVYALVTLYMEMKVAAHIQDRVAYMRTGWHGVLQPFADILKLLQKHSASILAIVGYSFEGSFPGGTERDPRISEQA